MSGIFDRLKNLIYSSRQPQPLTPEQAKEVAEQVKKATINMQSHCNWAQVEVDTAIEMARTYPKGHPRHEHYRRMLKLRLVMQQYMEKMSLTMETVSSQIEIAQLSTEMGQSLQGATQLVNTYKRDMPSFTSFVRDFMKTIAPMNEALNGGLDEMTDALDQLCGCTLDGAYADADLDALIDGTLPTIQPVIPPKPAKQEAQAQPQAAPTPTPAQVDELQMLLDIERGMPAYNGDSNA